MPIIYDNNKYKIIFPSNDGFNLEYLVLNDHIKVLDNIIPITMASYKSGNVEHHMGLNYGVIHNTGNIFYMFVLDDKFVLHIIKVYENGTIKYLSGKIHNLFDKYDRINIVPMCSSIGEHPYHKIYLHLVVHDNVTNIMKIFKFLICSNPMGCHMHCCANCCCNCDNCMIYPNRYTNVIKLEDVKIINNVVDYTVYPKYILIEQTSNYTIYNDNIDKYYERYNDDTKESHNVVEFDGHFLRVAPKQFSYYGEDYYTFVVNYHVCHSLNSNYDKNTLCDFYVTNKIIYFVYNNGKVCYHHLSNLKKCNQMDNSVGENNQDLKFYWNGNHSYFINKNNIYYHNGCHDIKLLDGCNNISLFETHNLIILNE